MMQCSTQQGSSRDRSRISPVTLERKIGRPAGTWIKSAAIGRTLKQRHSKTVLSNGIRASPRRPIARQAETAWAPARAPVLASRIIRMPNTVLVRAVSAFHSAFRRPAVSRC